MNCWCSCLGNCGNAISREHYVSAGIFQNKSVLVSGFSWSKPEPKEIQLSKAVSKILCETHNNNLSSFDSEASKMSKHLRNIRCNPLQSNKIEINGKNFEKWALKTFFNLGILGAFDQINFTKISPIESLVRYIYCDTEIENGIGLYFVKSSISSKDIGDYFTWNAIRNKSGQNEIIGMAFSISGLRFIVNTNPVLEGDSIKIDDISDSTNKVRYRPAQINFESENADTKIIQFNWK